MLSRRHCAVNSSIGRRLLYCLLLLTLVMPLDVYAEDAFPEAKIKAAYIYNFMRFVSWPTEVTRDEAQLCLYDVNMEYQEVFNAIPDTVKNKPLRVRFIKPDADLDTIDNCQLLYIASSKDKKIKSLLEHMKYKQCLTIGETGSFLEYGGMVRFVRHEDKVRFEINIEAANAADLKISSQLLKIAIRLVQAR